MRAVFVPALVAQSLPEIASFRMWSELEMGNDLIPSALLVIARRHQSPHLRLSNRLHFSTHCHAPLFAKVIGRDRSHFDHALDCNNVRQLLFKMAREDTVQRDGDGYGTFIAVMGGAPAGIIVWVGFTLL
jgi:hypothetical protein